MSAMALIKNTDKNKANKAKKPAGAKKSPKSKASDVNTSGGGNLGTYFKGVRAEWDKVSWPTKIQIWQQTIVTIIMVTIMTVTIFLLDSLFRTVIGLITSN